MVSADRTPLARDDNARFPMRQVVRWLRNIWDVEDEIDMMVFKGVSYSLPPAFHSLLHLGIRITLI